MSSGAVAVRIDGRALRRAFDRASDSYDRVASLQRQVRTELLSRLQYFTLQPQRIVDLGCGTAEGARWLQRRFPVAQVVAADLSTSMLRAARRHLPLWRRRFVRIGARAEQLPLASGSVDLWFSSLMLQWCEDPLPVFAEARRVLRPGGLLLLSSLGPETLRELRAAWGKADDGPHVSEFAHPAQVTEALGVAGLHEAVLDVDLYTRHYDDAHALMRELQLLGARNAAATRARGLTGKGRLRTMIATYESMRESGGLPASFEVIFASAFAAGARSSAAGAEFTVTPGEIRRAGPRLPGASK